MQSHLTYDATEPIPNEQLETLWNSVSNDLREELGEGPFSLWFSEFQLTHAGPEGITLLAPGTMYSIWVEENFKDSLLSVFRKHVAPCEQVRCEVVCSSISDTNISDKGSMKGEVTRLKPRVMVEKISESKLLERGRAAGLVDTFRFENFVSGENSDLAWAAAQAVAEQPGKTYQPLFFHSACGLGKTHLLHGIGWESLRRRPKSKIIFVTAERFANDYIEAIQKSSITSFRKKYREADLLLIDDVQFLGRKEGLQQEFFHTFNSLSDKHNQIVLASDCPASEINALEDRLVSRFQWGLSAEIHRPGVEMRAAILRRKRDDWGNGVSDEIIDAIVERVRGNVRVLEGALIRVAMVAAMNDDEEILLSDLDKILADICDGGESRAIGAQEIKRAVAEHYDLDLQILNGKKRTARVAEARQVAMFLVRKLTDLSLVEIGASFAKDHGTVIYAVKKVKAKCETSSSLKNTVELIKRRLVRSGSGDRVRGGNARQKSSGLRLPDGFDRTKNSGLLGNSDA